MLKGIVSFEEWRKKNPGLENWVECPHCFGSGEEYLGDWDEKCIVCNGAEEVNDLYSLYINDIEHDLRLVFAVYPPNKITPGLKEFLYRFHVDGVYP